MPSIVPTVPVDTANLADVLPGCLTAMGHVDLAVAALGREARITLRPVRSAIVVLVDGLGASALAASAGHARFLAASRRRLRSGFPTTTAAAITTLTTGADPGQHGVVGYSGYEPASGTVINLLGGWDDQVPAGWLLRPTLFTAAERSGVAARTVGPARYHSSGMTQEVLGGGTYVDADSIAARVDAAVAEVSGASQSLVYLYVPELDSIAHKHGWRSDRWTGTLEVLDAELARLAAAVPADVGVLVTADHGILDVPDTSNVSLDAALLEPVVGVAGDPRCRQLTLAPGTDTAEQVTAWRTWLGRRAWVASRAEAVDAGWFGAVDDAVLPRIGDVVIVARGSWAFNDDRDLRGEPKRMIGQHGGLSDEETFVPLVLAGAFAA
ncbi:alkaline phosphatase family protein [Curtobacterium sp. Leaf261]|uniref:alkaline phosphatase family protein n=1 Tax=Curtobacterium sp. Leaf261 TaxID=1736311 RepID=UPI0006F4F8EE|nr:alkaline phosphatase family protein [Curtobacterium sp. Leaf261]KQO64946.1 hypothetical protein ASF23_01960 [Curtobacterium sp. Leaf261]